jgi:hypothetical protein
MWLKSKGQRVYRRHGQRTGSWRSTEMWSKSRGLKGLQKKWWLEGLQMWSKGIIFFWCFTVRISSDVGTFCQ